MHVNSGLSLKPEFLLLFVLYEMQSRASFDVNQTEEINKINAYKLCLLLKNKKHKFFLIFSKTIHVENTPT